MSTHTQKIAFKKFFAFFLFAGVGLHTSPMWGGTCKESPATISLASEQDISAFKDWLKTDSSDAANLNFRNSAPEYYVVDANNDGKKEIVAATHQGSGGYLNLDIFSETPSGFQPITDSLPTPQGNPDLWIQHEFYDPISGKNSVFASVCGKVYLLLNNGTISEPMRQGYLWQNGNISRACDATWLKFDKDLFQKLYDQKRNDAAASILSGNLEFCSEQPANDRLWRENDLILTTYKRKEFQSCLDLIQTMKAEPAFKSASPEFIKAAAFNESLCLKGQADEIKAAGRGAYDYSWLLKLSERGNEVVWDKRYDGLLSAAVPDVRRAGEKETLKKNFRNRLFLSDSKTISHQNIVMTGCVPHDCLSKGFLWVDVKTQISVGARLDQGNTESLLILFSKSATKSSIPPEALVEIKNWLKQKNATPTKIEFVGLSGQFEEIELSDGK